MTEPKYVVEIHDEVGHLSDTRYRWIVTHGTPILWYMNDNGIPMYENKGDYGWNMTRKAAKRAAARWIAGEERKKNPGNKLVWRMEVTSVPQVRDEEAVEDG